MTDFLVQNEGTIIVLFPETDEAYSWVEEHINPDAQRWGRGGVVVEHRYFPDILEGITADGLTTMAI